MKRLNKEEKDKIKCWEDIPLSVRQLKRVKILDITKSRSIMHKDDISGEDLEWLRKAVNNNNKIYLDVEQDYDFVEEVLENILINI